MEDKMLRIRINLDTREFEAEGDAEYIMDTFGPDIREYIDAIRKDKHKEINRDVLPMAHSGVVVTDKAMPLTPPQMPDSFGEYYNKFPKNLSNVDKMLIASYYVQATKSTKCFSIQEATELLLDQSVKLSNANAFNTANIGTKRVFKFGGKDFKVSETGIEHINSLLSR